MTHPFWMTPFGPMAVTGQRPLVDVAMQVAEIERQGRAGQFGPEVQAEMEWRRISRSTPDEIRRALRDAIARDEPQPVLNRILAALAAALKRNEPPAARVRIQSTIGRQTSPLYQELALDDESRLYSQIWQVPNNSFVRLGAKKEGTIYWEHESGRPRYSGRRLQWQYVTWHSPEDGLVHKGWMDPSDLQPIA